MARIIECKGCGEELPTSHLIYHDGKCDFGYYCECCYYEREE